MRALRRIGELVGIASTCVCAVTVCALVFWLVVALCVVPFALLWRYVLGPDAHDAPPQPWYVWAALAAIIVGTEWCAAYRAKRGEGRAS